MLEWYSPYIWSRHAPHPFKMPLYTQKDHACFVLDNNDKLQALIHHVHQHIDYNHGSICRSTYQTTPTLENFEMDVDTPVLSINSLDDTQLGHDILYNQTFGIHHNDGNDNLFMDPNVPQDNSVTSVPLTTRINASVSVLNISYPAYDIVRMIHLGIGPKTSTVLCTNFSGSRVNKV